jgi:hypothetical protein
MRHSPPRRLFAALFGLLFAASGLTRELAGTCPQHANATGAGAAAVHDAHHAHATGSATHPGEPTDTGHGAHCDCIGDCCGCAIVRLDGAPPIVVADATPVAAPTIAHAAIDRPAARVDIALPFATAPPTSHAT